MALVVRRTVIFQGNTKRNNSHLSLIHKKFEAGPKNRSHFSQATHNWERCGCPKQSFISAISVWKIYTKVVVLNTCVAADRSTLDNSTAARGTSQQRFHEKNQPITCPAREWCQHQYTFCNFAARYRSMARRLRTTAVRHAARWCLTLFWVSAYQKKTLYETYFQMLRSRKVVDKIGSDDSISELGA